MIAMGKSICHEQVKIKNYFCPGVGLSASYTTLLTWLLSLVPENFAYLQHDNAKPEVTSPWMLPFYVIGCQQMLMDDQLYLMVAVTPVEQFDAKWIPTKARKSKVLVLYDMSRVARKQSSRFLTRSDTNRPEQLQKNARSFKF